jgi:hypothetical protein
MHSAGLTVFVGSFHNSRFGQFQFTKFFGKLVTRLSTLFAQSVLCVEVTQIWVKKLILFVFALHKQMAIPA